MRYHDGMFLSFVSFLPALSALVCCRLLLVYVFTFRSSPLLILTFSNVLKYIFLSLPFLHRASSAPIPSATTREIESSCFTVRTVRLMFLLTSARARDTSSCSD